MEESINIYKICTLLSSFGQRMYGQKVLNIWPLQFLDKYVFVFFIILCALFELIGIKWVVKKGVYGFKLSNIISKSKRISIAKKWKQWYIKTDSKLIIG